MVDKNIIELIDRITTNIKESNLNISKIRKNLRAVNNIKNFKNELMQILESYYEETEEKLFSKEEYNELINIRTYIDVRNMMIIDLI